MPSEECLNEPASAARAAAIDASADGLRPSFNNLRDLIGEGHAEVDKYYSQVGSWALKINIKKSRVS